MAKYYVGVGINAYSSSPLNGCINDIEDMFDLLSNKFEFYPGDNMRLLCDSRATKAAIWDRLTWLVSVAKEGDICVFNYSGHGASLPNRKYNGEVDGIDECLVPFDFDWTYDRMLLDDDLGKIADGVANKGAIPTFIIDACHSGTILRDFSFQPPKKVRYILPPIDIRARITPKLKTRTIANKVEDNENAILISGCKENQTSADAYFKGRYNGALTYSLVKALNKNSNMTYIELEKILSKDLEGKFSQTPMVIGTEKLLNRKVFA